MKSVRKETFAKWKSAQLTRGYVLSGWMTSVDWPHGRSSTASNGVGRTELGGGGFLGGGGVPTTVDCPPKRSPLGFTQLGLCIIFFFFLGGGFPGNLETPLATPLASLVLVQWAGRGWWWGVGVGVLNWLYPRSMGYRGLLLAPHTCVHSLMTTQLKYSFISYHLCNTFTCPQ